MGNRPLVRRFFRGGGLFKSIHSTSILLLLAALLPLIALQITGIYTRYDSFTAHELRASQELAEATGAAFVNFVSTLWNTMGKIGGVVSGQHLSLSSSEVQSVMG